MPFSAEALDALFKEHQGPNGFVAPESMYGVDELLDQLTKALVERVSQGEMTHHLGIVKNSA